MLQRSISVGSNERHKALTLNLASNKIIAAIMWLVRAGTPEDMYSMGKKISSSIGN